MSVTDEEFRAIFGPDSNGQNVRARARSSKQKFVRSQVQLAFDSEDAKGYRMTAEEALDAYGIEKLLEVANEGSSSLVERQSEPALTFSRRRDDLGLTVLQVARSAGVSEEDIKRAEKIGASSPIRTLIKIAQALALDERKISFEEGAGGDKRLGVRLRQMTSIADAKKFTAIEVVALAEASWVISKQHLLAKFIGEVRPALSHMFQPSSSYSYPTYEKGYNLAKETRRILGLNSEEPIVSLRTLLEERLGVPLIQLKLSEKFAGATLANGDKRGVVVNEAGLNNNVWIRRMTLAHEIGHLLWDPDERLDRLTVDKYDEIDFGSKKQDEAEMRANAFAVSFLAPADGIRKLAANTSTPSVLLSNIIKTYGISVTAARNHASNILKISFDGVSGKELPQPTSDWITAENLSVDYFNPQSTPISRRGRFAWYVAKAWHEGIITDDSAASYLQCSKEELEASKINLFSVVGID